MLFHQLIQLVISRLQKTNKKTHKKTILLNKSLFLLEDLISFKCLPYSKQEDELVPLYDLLQKPNKINLSKEVFSLIVTAIEQQGSLGSSSIEKLFCIMPSCIRINNCQLEGSFQLINYFLYYGKGFVGANLGTLEQLVELASFCLSPSEGNEEEINQALAALIIQGIILNYNDIMGVELWDKIYTKVLNRVLEGIQSRFLKGCLCNIIWASFFTRFELMQELLLKSGKFNGIFEFILKEALVYSTVYDKKVKISYIYIKFD